MNLRLMRRRTVMAALAAAVALMLVGAGGAQAKLVELTGATTITPSAQATKFLADHGVTVDPIGEATTENGAFVFPIVAGFGNTKTFNGLLAHSGGLKFTKGDRSAVVRRFVAVRAGRVAVVLAQIPGLRGGCGQLRQALRHFAATHSGYGRAARKHPKAVRHLLRAVKSYCSTGRVIVLAKLTNLGKKVNYGGALLTADLELSRPAARLINRAAREKVVSAGALIGSAESQVNVVKSHY